MIRDGLWNETPVIGHQSFIYLLPYGIWLRGFGGVGEKKVLRGIPGTVEVRREDGERVKKKRRAGQKTSL